MALAGRALHRVLEVVTIALLVVLALLVITAVAFRYGLNASLPWYDEVASVLLAWITYYGAALAALRRGHLGFAGLVLSLPPLPRKLLFVLAELIVYTVFVSMAWAGWFVLQIMAGETLVSLDWVPLQFTQSVVPIGCVLFILAQILSTPDAWARIVAGLDVEAEEIEAEIAKAERTQAEIEAERDRREPPRS
ncbi:TRAP transporter small permease [Pelagibius sp.]|uniref:TRAP transporter small permease n=1 Tax=Pelagibius sp. TaxID=1931238 RepID=UPI0026217E84|nr:TRAP transporter small permease subunit [Pelagibius sp.]